LNKCIVEVIIAQTCTAKLVSIASTTVGPVTA